MFRTFTIKMTISTQNTLYWKEKDNNRKRNTDTKEDTLKACLIERKTI